LPTPTPGGTKLSAASRPDPRRLAVVARRQQRGAFVAASSVSATTTAIGWLA
jgi:hypothetical protein